MRNRISDITGKFRNIPLILIFLVLHLPSLFVNNTYAQTDLLHKKITINVNEISLENALEQLSDISGVHFAYSSKIIDAGQYVSINADNQPLGTILDKLFSDTGIQYTVMEKQIVLHKSKERADTATKDKPEKYTFSGYIRDDLSNEVLIGVAVYIRDLEIGTITNAYGYYSITLMEGIYQVTLSYIGYKPIDQEINLNDHVNRNFNLELNSEILQEIIVDAAIQEDIYENTQISQVDILPKSIMEMPALMGEMDVIKSLQSIPGIKLYSDGSTFFHVRGGDKDQNLILLDEAPIYNPTHLLGFFSTFMPDALKDIKVYKGNYPARFGGRISSLIDIRTKDGNMNRFNMSGGIGLISSRLSLEGPLIKGKSSIFLSGRRSHIGWYMRQFNPDIKNLYFYDFNTKVNYTLNRNNRFYFSYYTGEDFFSEGQAPKSTTGVNWKNSSGTFRWNHIFNDRLFSNTTIYGSTYDYYLLTSIENNAYWNSHISNFTIKSDFTFFSNPSNTIDFGIKIAAHRFNPGNFQVGDGIIPNGIPVVSAKNASEFTIYASNEHKVAKRITLNYGFRLTNWKNLGEAFEFEYDDNYFPIDTTYYAKGERYNNFVGFEPRLGLVWKSGKNNSIKASYTHSKQYINLISNSISPFTSLEVWLPAGPNIQPQSADMITTGFFQYFRDKAIEISIESWYRVMRNQIDYVDHANMLMNPLIERELRFGNGRSYGIDFLLMKKLGRLNGWLGYSWSRAFRQFKELNGGRKYPAYFDRPHDFTLYVNYKLSERLSLSGNWLLMSGNTFSSPTDFYSYNGHTIPIYSEKNNDRLPTYHRLDLSMMYRLNKKDQRFEHSLGIGLYNIYGHKNPIYINFNKIDHSEQGIKIPGNLITPPNLLPTHMYLYNFVPSITYNFKLK